MKLKILESLYSSCNDMIINQTYNHKIFQNDQILTMNYIFQVWNMVPLARGVGFGQMIGTYKYH